MLGTFCLRCYFIIIYFNLVSTTFLNLVLSSHYELSATLLSSNSISSSSHLYCVSQQRRTLTVYNIYYRHRYLCEFSAGVIKIIFISLQKISKSFYERLIEALIVFDFHERLTSVKLMNYCLLE